MQKQTSICLVYKVEPVCSGVSSSLALEPGSSWWEGVCVNGILPVTSQCNRKSDFETIILMYENYIVLL